MKQKGRSLTAEAARTFVHVTDLDNCNLQSHNILTLNGRSVPADFGDF